ncbi:hypothetical protein ABZY34_04745 [Streptomyces virginiae]|uniref:hypothetical protein n=1 Tax=Streptomyces virginiae TaxID=1961 RepID=UPI0033B6046D
MCSGAGTTLPGGDGAPGFFEAGGQGGLPAQPAPDGRAAGGNGGQGAIGSNQPGGSGEPGGDSYVVISY